MPNVTATLNANLQIQTLNYTITHRPRVTRRLHLELDAEGELLVVVPPSWSRSKVQALMLQNTAKVKRFIERARQERLEPLGYETGALHFYQGARYPLRLVSPDDRSQPSGLMDDTIKIRTKRQDSESIKAALRHWYRQQAGGLFAARLQVLAMRTPWVGEDLPELRLRRMKRTWGTCNRKGLVRLNTHLVKAAITSLDYVIAHELCHLQEMNHGKAFYQLLNSIYPDWRAQRRHLRACGNRYIVE